MRARSFGDEPVGDAFLHEQPRARAAHLALVEPDRVDDAFHDAVEIRVVVDDERTLSAQLEAQLLARPGRRLADDAADFGRSGERDLVDVGMVDDRRAGLAVAVHDVDHAGGNPRLVRDLREAQRRERRELGRLENDRISAASAGAIFHASMSSGKFHGMIWPTTPIAS